MLVKIILAVACVISIHLLAMAFCARLLGITVRMISFGIGPTIFASGRFRISLIPIGGNLQLVMLADASEGIPVSGTLDGAARWKRVLLALSGPLALLVMGILLLGRPGVDQFIQAFPQFLAGAWSPFGNAQGLLHDAANLLDSASAIQILGIVSCKVAAFNLLPFFGSNGLAAATSLLPQATLDGNVMKRLQEVIVLPLTLLLVVAWMLAIGKFLLSH